jgi:hypothetical protein
VEHGIAPSMADSPGMQSESSYRVGHRLKAGEPAHPKGHSSFFNQRRNVTLTDETRDGLVERPVWPQSTPDAGDSLRDHLPARIDFKATNAQGERIKAGGLGKIG